ncbi:BAG family molecular chaperone regulator 6 [Abeliophyllum distichum]|uniref:BAG family molecular chaperone regulator 6 n=1 Tax=Abeliophyllum distichum TaxID=126358 RepID=A0ABD1NUF6_9LAMI
MDPAYGCVQLYPYQKGQVHYRPYYCPNTESVPTPMYADLAQFPMNYECCPWGSNYGYSYPVLGHGCCNPSHFPGHYAWRPPYSHVPPVHCNGNHSSFQSTHPIPYVPVHDYSIGHPRYEYERNMPHDHHCCGCLNHSCNKREERNVRIEEEDPDLGRKANESLVPLQSKNFPIVWFPPDSRNNKEDRKSNDLEYTNQKEDSHNNPKSIEQKPTVWNGWFPHDVNNLESLKQKGGDRERKQNQQDDGKGNFPFPIFWMPYKPEEMDKKEHPVNNVGPEPSPELIKPADSGDDFKVNGEHNINVSSRKKDIPVKQVDQHDDGKGHFPFPIFWMPYKPREMDKKEHPVNNVGPEPSPESVKRADSGDDFKVNGEHTNINVSSRKKDIPVKQVDQHDEKENLGNYKTKESNTSVKDLFDNGEKRHSEGSAKRKSPSPPKASKLPPVCLRVDPLPRRKNSKGSSRSLSPPGEKGKLNHSYNEESILSNSSKTAKPDTINDNEFKEEMTNKKTIEAKEGKTEQGGSVDVNTATPPNLPVTSEKDIWENQTDERSTEEKPSTECTRADKADVKGQSDDTGSQIVEKEELSRGKEVIANEVEEPKRKKLTDLKAAIIIQSAYRGFAIRRREPLKKLKQIAKVREQIAVIKLLIQEMELSSDIRLDNKKINMIGETIMNLLLKLDTVQGLHPCIRDIRKSVARELVSLQEKLDLLINKKPEASPGHESANGGDEGALKETKDDASTQGGHGVENTSVDSILSENTNEAGTHLVECHDQLEGGSKYENMEISEPMLVEDQLGGNLENKSTEISESCGIEIIEAGPKPDVKLGDEQSCEVQEKKEESISVPLTESGKEMTNSPTIDGDTSPSELADDDIDAQGCIEHRKIESGKCDVMENKVKADVEQAKQIEEGSKAQLVSTELKDNIRHDENKEDIELSVPKASDIQVQAEEEKMSLINEFVKISDNTDDKIGSEEMMGDKIGDAGAEFDENTSQPSQNTGVKMKESKAANDKTGSEEMVEDMPGDDIAESDECTSQPPCTMGPKITESKGGVDKIGSVDVVDDKPGAELPGELVEEKLGDAMAKSDECTFKPPHNTGFEIEEREEAEHKIKSEEMADGKLGYAIAYPDKCTSPLPQNAGEEINGLIEASDEWKQQMCEEPCQGENEMNTVPEAFGGDDPKKSSTCGKVLDTSTERKASLAQEYKGEQFQPDQDIEVQESESSGGNEKTATDHCFFAASECDVPDVMACVPAEVTEVENENISPASLTASHGSHDSSDMTERNKKLMEENEKLREMMEKLIKAGQEQLATISSLSGRVEDLEKRLSKKKKLKGKSYKAPSSGLSFKKPSYDHLKNRTMGMAM